MNRMSSHAISSYGLGGPVSPIHVRPPADSGKRTAADTPVNFDIPLSLKIKNDHLDSKSKASIISEYTQLPVYPLNKEAMEVKKKSLQYRSFVS